MHTKNVLYDDLNKIKAILAKTAMDAKNEATHAAFDSLDEMREKSLKAKDNFQEYVKKKPLVSIGLSVLAGMLISRILSK